MSEADTSYAVTVRHVSKNHVQILPAAGWTVVIFNIHASPAIVATSDDGFETIKLGLASPRANQIMTVRIGTPENPRAIDVIYGDKSGD